MHHNRNMHSVINHSKITRPSYWGWHVITVALSATVQHFILKQYVSLMYELRVTYDLLQCVCNF
jgi:hypothetical protein